MKILNKVREYKDIATSAISFQSWNLTKAGKTVDSWLASTINTANTTPYDKAIDSVYLQTHIGGSNLHHIVDGQHDVVGAFEAASNALPNDSIASEIYGTAAHLTKDLFSASGIPFFSIDKETYKNNSTWIADNLGISKSWQSDLLQINAMELFGGLLGVFSVIFALKKKDVSALSELGLGMGLGSVAAANPVSMAVSLLSLVLAYKKHGDVSEIWNDGKSGLLTSGATLVVSMLMSPIAGSLAGSLVVLILSLALGLVIRKFVSKNQSAEVEDDKNWNHFIQNQKDSFIKKYPTQFIDIFNKTLQKQ